MIINCFLLASIYSDPDLLHRIDELVKGFVSSQSKVYGDPTILESVNLQDLHPGSWLVVCMPILIQCIDKNHSLYLLREKLTLIKQSN